MVGTDRRLQNRIARIIEDFAPQWERGLFSLFKHFPNQSRASEPRAIRAAHAVGGFHVSTEVTALIVRGSDCASGNPVKI